MKFSELKRTLGKKGWKIVRTSKHHILEHPSISGQIQLGKHLSQEVPKGTLEKILKHAGLH